MAPSRANKAITPTHTDDQEAVVQQGNSALQNAKRNFAYLMSPATATSQPTRFRTRALLRTVRYITQFIFWRTVRWAKYAAIGALVAGISATAIGSVVTGAAWVVAPTGIAASIMASVVWGVGKFMARKLNKRWKATGKDEGTAQRELGHTAGEELTTGKGVYTSMEVGPRASPW